MRNESSACFFIWASAHKVEADVPSTAYYVKQAELCLKLAGLSDKEETKNHLITLAATHKLKAMREMTSAKDLPGRGATTVLV